MPLSYKDQDRISCQLIAVIRFYSILGLRKVTTCGTVFRSEWYDICPVYGPRICDADNPFEETFKIFKVALLQSLTCPSV